MNEELFDISEGGNVADDWPSVIRDDNKWISEGGSGA